MEFIIRQEVDLARESRSHVMRYAQPLEYGDAGAHRWMVTIRKDGAAVDLGAMSAKCYVTRAAGDAERAQGVTSVTVILDAQIDAQSGTVSCVFDAACYGGVGAATAILRLSDAAGGTMTAACLTARLRRSTSDAVYDPEGLVPSMDALLAQIATIEAATRAANEAAAAANAAAQSANFVVLGQYDTLALLQAAHPAGSAGDAWAIGEAEPYDVYVWDVDRAAWANIGPLQGAKGEKGVGIAQIARTAGDGSAGSVDTYTITYTDGTSTTYQVKNGADGRNGQDGKQGPQGEQGVGIASIARTAGDGSAGSVDTYTITFTNGTSTTYQVTNGRDGSNGQDGAPGRDAPTYDQSLNTTDAVTFSSVTADVVYGAVFME